MKINWRVRVKNPYFWIGLLGMFFCAIGVDGSTITSWPILLDNLKSFISNPYLIVSVVIAFIGYIQDPTTEGFGDSEQALSYSKPKAKKEENGHG